MEPFEASYQVGNVIKICRKLRRAKENGFILNSEHVIVEPPKNHMNCGMHVWVKNINNELKSLKFYEFYWTGKTVEVPKIVQRKRLNKLKRKRLNR